MRGKSSFGALGVPDAGSVAQAPRGFLAARLTSSLAVRHPELPAAKDNEAYQRAQDLCNLSPAAQLYRLGEMNLADAVERRRLMSYVRERIAAARQEADDRLMEMIDAYPGVLYFWTNEANRSAMATGNDLRRACWRCPGSGGTRSLIDC